mmetsp:Transcript_21680/g.56271  ORF Transcript_21680/g.56271 Transcript_21680/m.56271 type:complete len:193 (-) Transcript_21680:180-758(-)
MRTTIVFTSGFLLGGSAAHTLTSFRERVAEKERHDASIERMVRSFDADAESMEEEYEEDRARAKERKRRQELDSFVRSNDLGYVLRGPNFDPLFFTSTSSDCRRAIRPHYTVEQITAGKAQVEGCTAASERDEVPRRERLSGLSTEHAIEQIMSEVKPRQKSGEEEYEHVYEMRSLPSFFDNVGLKRFPLFD